MFDNAPRLAASVASTVFLCPAIAWAQEVPHESQLEEIVVTADRPRSFSADLLQAGTFQGGRQLDTPLTVSIIPRTLLDAQQASNLGDGLRNTAGVTGLLTSPTVYNNLSIRGIPVDGRGNYRLNGSLPIVNFIDLPLENKARIEALKGVSALYYGFTTPSGIINLVTKRPPNDPLFDVTVSGNGHGQLQAAIEVGATQGILGLRGTLVGGRVESGIERTSGYRTFQAVTLQITPSDRLQLDVDAEHIFKQVTEPTILQGPTNRARLLTELPKLPSLTTNAGSRGFLNRAREYNLLTRIRWNASPAWRLTLEAGISSATRDRRFSTLQNLDARTGNGSLNVTVAKDQRFRNRMIRADLAGTFTTGKLTHELLLGTSNNLRRQYLAPAILVAGVASQQGREGCLALGLATTCVQNSYDPIALRDLVFDAETPYDPSRDTLISDTGIYALDRIRFGGRRGELVTLLLGLRKSFYRESVAHAGKRWRTTFSDDPLSPSAALILKPVSWGAAYATYLQGIQALPPAPNTTANAGEILPPGETRQYEMGVKLEPLKGLLLTAAYFSIRRRLSYVNSANFFVRDGLGKYRGWELGLSGEITADLSIYASGMMLNAIQRLTGDPVLDGNRPENTAKIQWSLFGEYRLRKIVPGLAISAGAFHTGARAINPENSLFVPRYTLFDVGASYSFRLGGRNFVARATAHNVTGKRYIASTSFNLLALGAPPTVKLSLLAHLQQ